MPDAILVLLAILAAGYVGGEASKRAGIPRVAGQIAAGVVLATPFIREVLFDARADGLFTLLATVGSILLFFFVGLEIDMRSFRRNFRESIFISIFNTAVPFTAGFFIMRLLGFDFTSALVAGVALAVSSAAASLDFLEEMNMLKTRVGSIIITAGTVDDVTELVLMGIILALFHTTISSGSPDSILLGIAAFAVIIAAFKLWVVPAAMEFFEHSNNRTAMFTGALLITLLMAGLGQILGIGSLIGAFVAGVLVRHVLVAERHRRPWEKHELTHSIHTLAFGFFVPVFFVWAGYQVDIGVALQNLPLGMLLSAIAIIGTVLGTAAGVLASKGTLKEGLLVGWGVTAKGDVEIVIATLALGAGIISQTLFSAVIFMALTTTLVGPVAFRHYMKEAHRETAEKEEARKRKGRARKRK